MTKIWNLKEWSKEKCKDGDSCHARLAYVADACWTCVECLRSSDGGNGWMQTRQASCNMQQALRFKNFVRPFSSFFTSVLSLSIRGSDLNFGCVQPGLLTICEPSTWPDPSPFPCGWTCSAPVAHRQVPEWVVILSISTHSRICLMQNIHGICICGYSDTPLTVTLFAFPEGVTVSGHVCIHVVVLSKPMFSIWRVKLTSYRLNPG